MIITANENTRTVTVTLANGEKVSKRVKDAGLGIIAAANLLAEYNGLHATGWTETNGVHTAELNVSF